MYFTAIVIGIFLLSLFLAFRSLKQLKESKEIGTVKQELKKGKVVFQSDVPSREHEAESKKF